MILLVNLVLAIIWKRYAKIGDEEKPRTTGRNVVVCMDMDRFEKIEIPDWLRQKLETNTNGD